jgi:tetratricopeptide (TPR) repeat protein
VFDYDHDGRQDLALTFRTGPRLALLRNEGARVRSLMLALEGRRANRDAVGAWVTVRTSERTLARFVRSGSGFLSQSSRRLHFGLRANESVRDIEIEWPGGPKQMIGDPPQSGPHAVAQGEPPRPLRVTPRRVKPEPAPQTPSPWLSEPVPTTEKTSRAMRLLAFHADWCPPCRAQSNEWRATRLDRRIELREIDVDRAPMAYWNLLRRHLFDLREDLALPTSFLLDARGRIVKVYRGITTAGAILADAAAGRGPDLPFGGRWITGRPRRNFTELATALAEHGLLDESRPYFALAQPDLESRMNYAALLLDQGNLPESENLLRGVLRARPDDVEALANLGVCLLRQSKPAQEVLERLVRLQPDDASAFELLGLARLRDGRVREAIDAYESARRRGRETREVLSALSKLYEQIGDTARAKEIAAVIDRLPAQR